VYCEAPAYGAAGLEVGERKQELVIEGLPDAVELGVHGEASRRLLSGLSRRGAVAGGQGDATLRLRIPIGHVQEAVARLSALGRITAENVSIRDVQPGVGNPLSPHETYTLAEMSERTLHVLKTRNDIACVLVNPLQALHPNGNAPADSALADSSRKAHFDRAAYTRWLKSLREVCTMRNIVLIFDEVFVGFRLAAGGAQEYFGVRADMVTYGKSLAGGLPVGAVCGRKDLMRRFRDDRPVDVCFARGTFNSHPYVMTAMDEFLSRLVSPNFSAIYNGLDETWNGRARDLNDRLAAQNLPVRVANLSSIWMVHYTEPSRYNWMLQYYLRAEGLALSWVGTGRLIFSLNYTDADFAEVANRFVAAAEKMKQDGWWWHDASLTNKKIRRQILKEMITRRRAP